MKLFLVVFFSSLTFANVSASDALIQSSNIQNGFNSSIQKHLPDAIRCTNVVVKTKEFKKRMKEVYGDEAGSILAKFESNSLYLTFKPYYAQGSVYASTNMVGTIKINNRKDKKTLASLTNTVAHESTHNLKFRHSDLIQPDVSYTVGNIAEDLVNEGLCKSEAEPKIITKRFLIKKFFNELK